MRYLKYCIFLLFSILTLIGCDYQFSDDNYVELTQPASSHNFNLSLTPGSDTIVIYKNTTFDFDVNSYGLDIWKTEFQFGKQSWTTYDDNGSFPIYIENLSDSIYKLIMTVYSHSGSGSISDYFGNEGYVIQKAWTVIIDREIPASVKVSRSITEDGYLKYTWDKPTDRFRFKYYAVDIYSDNWDLNQDYYTETHKISDYNKKYFVDSVFWGGGGRCQVGICLNDDNVVWSEFLDFKDTFPSLNIDRLSTDSIRLFWNKSPYRVKYTIRDGWQQTLFTSTQDTSYVFVNTTNQIGTNIIFFISPIDTDSATYSNSHHEYLGYSWNQIHRK